MANDLLTNLVSAYKTFKHKYKFFNLGIKYLMSLIDPNVEKLVQMAEHQQDLSKSIDLSLEPDDEARQVAQTTNKKKPKSKSIFSANDKKDTRSISPSNSNNVKFVHSPSILKEKSILDSNKPPLSQKKVSLAYK